jgi:hypothetical protein
MKSTKTTLDNATRQQLVARLDQLTEKAQALPPATRADQSSQPQPLGKPNKRARPDIYEPEEESTGPSLFDLALVGVGAFFLFRWLLQRKK